MTRKMLVFIAVAVQLIAVQLCASEIHDAAMAGNVEQVRALLDANPSLVNERDTALSLPIHLAANRGHAAIVELLLSRGADINAGDRENTSPLVNAAMGNRMDVVRLLVERGAQVEAKDINGESAILSAARRANLEWCGSSSSTTRPSMIRAPVVPTACTLLRRSAQIHWSRTCSPKISI